MLGRMSKSDVKNLYKTLHTLKVFLISAVPFTLYGPNILVLLHQNSSEESNVFKCFAGLKLRHLIKYFFFNSGVASRVSSLKSADPVSVMA